MEELIKNLSLQDLFELRRQHHLKLRDKITVVKPSFKNKWCVYSVVIKTDLTNGETIVTRGVGQTTNLQQRATEYKSRLVTGTSTPNTGDSIIAQKLASVIGNDLVETIVMTFEVLISLEGSITRGDKNRLEWLCQEKLKEEYGDTFHSKVPKPLLSFDDEALLNNWTKGNLWHL